MKFYLGYKGYDNGYRFIYDDEDKSVMFCQCDKNYQIIQFKSYESVSNLEEFDFKYNKIRGSWEKNLCKYSLGDLVTTLCVGMNGEDYQRGRCYVKLYIFKKTGGQIKLKVNHGYGFYDHAGVNLCHIIPLEMLYYLLRLHSDKDFSGIMTAFDGLLGEDLDKVLSGVVVSVVSLEEWY